MTFEEWSRAIQSTSASERLDAADDPPFDDPNEGEVVRLLALTLNDSHHLVRVCVADSLGDFDSEESRKALRRAIRLETDEMVVGHALISLGMVGEEEDFSVFAKFFGKADAGLEIRIGRSEGLMHLSLRKALSSLVQVYRDGLNSAPPDGLTSLERIVERMHETNTELCLLAQERLKETSSDFEREILQSIISSR
jgi:HEAT repeats